jgi:predicted NAD/FAD-binding protein
MSTGSAAPHRRVAVIGSGVAGLTAAWVLQRSAEVTLFEADGRTGGHAHTHDIASPAGPVLGVDTGFLVHNRRTYPILCRLFDELGVATQPSEMSMSVVCEGCGLEYAGGRGAAGVLARPRSVLRPQYLRMLTEIPRFHRAARALLARPADGADAADGSEQTLGTFLAEGGYSRYFVNHFMAPVVSAVWSCNPDTALRYPARYLFTFLSHHGLLSVTGSPQWRTVSGGSRSYVDAVTKQLAAVHTSTPVRALTRTAAGVQVTDDTGTRQDFDAAVVATHPDQALALLAEPTAPEREVLGAFPYSRNETLLHTDASVLPSSRGAAASWNYRLAGCEARPEHVLVSYDVSRLQRLAGPQRFVVTLNPQGRVRAGDVLARMMYSHPVYTPESVAAQRRLPDLDDDRIAFAGAYHGWGFHEDGARAGLAAARRLGGSW